MKSTFLAGEKKLTKISPKSPSMFCYKTFYLLKIQEAILHNTKCPYILPFAGEGLYAQPLAGMLSILLAQTPPPLGADLNI